MPGTDVNLTRRQIVLLKTETTYGVDADPSEATSYDSMKLIDPFTLDITQEFVEVTGGNLTRGWERPLPTVRPAGLTFRAYMVGVDQSSFTAANKPPLSDALRACGLFETFVSSSAAGESEYQYAPAADPSSDTSVTIIAHQDGFEHRLAGCRGNVNFIFSAAGPVIAEFTYRGLLLTEAETTRATPTGLPTTVPPRWVDSGSIIVQSLDALVENLNLNTNNTVLEQRASQAASGSGIVAIILTERAPGGSFDPEVSRVGSHDFVNLWRSASASVLNINVGLDSGNKFSMTGSRMIYKSLGWGDKSGLSIWNNDYQMYEASADDEYLITFTG